MTVIATYIVPHPPTVIPEVGKGNEDKIRSTSDALHKISREIAELAPDTIVLTSPHSTTYWDYFHVSKGKSGKGDLSRFGVLDVNIDVNYDLEFITTLSQITSEHNISSGTDGENEAELDHGTVVPLYFINKYYTDYNLVHIGLSGLDRVTHYRFGKAIAETAEKLNRKIVFIASGDLSHKLSGGGPYGFASEGPRFDKILVKSISKGDFLGLMQLDGSMCEAAAQCGLNSFIVMAGALDGKAVESELLSYEGPFGVGYAVASFKPMQSDPHRHFDTIVMQEQATNDESEEHITASDEDIYVNLARYVIEEYVNSKRIPSLPKNLPNEMLERQAGVFVTCKKRGELRGCIGTISPTSKCVAEEIIRNAVASVSQDPRFLPVTEGELPELTYSVDVLGAPEDAEISELDPQKYGVIVTQGSKRGLLLPALDGVDTADAQVEIAKQKAGITGDNYKLERFEVVRHV